MADTLTKNFKFVKPAFNKKPWQQSFYDSMDAIDAILARYILVSNFVGVWNQATAYTAGQRVVDTVGGAIYTCNVNHTSTAINTFAQDRIANPSFWTIFTFSVQFRGTWVTNTDYSTGDFVVFGQKLAVANSTHHSSASFIVDQANGLWNVLIDGTAVAALPTGTAANADQTIRYDGVSLQYQLTANHKVSSAGVTTLPAGAVGAPSLTFNGQGGFYSPGANLVAHTVGGVEIWRFKNDGTTTLAFPDAFRQGLGFPAAAAANIGRTIGWDNVTGLTLVSQGPLVALKNRVINGDMRLDQRNVGAAYSAPSVSLYTLDRWQAALGQPTKLSFQRLTSSPPAGFTHHLLVAGVPPGYTAIAGDVFALINSIEGNYIADLDWGKATAKPVVVSFWVKCTFTGTFTCALRNFDGSRSYAATYTISSANTWTFITIPIVGDTAGTWQTDINAGILFTIDLGSGSTFTGTGNVWQAGNILRATGQTDFVAVNGASLNITGIQLEVGTVPTAFDFRPLPVELRLCQRYFQKSFAQATAPVQNLGLNTGEAIASAVTAGVALININTRFPVPMRTTPTAVFYNPNAANGNARDISISVDCGAPNPLFNDCGGRIQYLGNAGTVANSLTGVHYTLTAEL